MELNELISSGAGGSAEVIKGALVNKVSDTLSEGMLPLDGNYFSPTDFPDLSTYFPKNKLPRDTSGEKVNILTGVEGLPILVSNGLNLPFTGPLGTPAGVSFKVADTDKEGTWVVGEGRSVSRSTDNGLTWSALPQGFGVHGTVYGTEYLQSIKTDGKGTWIAVMGQGLAVRSDDNGSTWSGLPLGLNSGGGGYIHKVETDGKGVWVSAHYSGYASRSTDNGITWSPLVRFLNTQADSAGPSGAVSGFEELVTDKNGVWVATSTYQGYASRSTDNGLTWLTLPKGLSQTNTNYAIKLDTDRTGFWIAISQAGFASKSYNNGLSWSQAGTVTSTNVTALTTDGNGIWFRGDQQGYTYYSKDNGSSWLAAPRGLGSQNVTTTCIETDENGLWLVGGTDAKVTLANAVTADEYRIV